MSQRYVVLHTHYTSRLVEKADQVVEALLYEHLQPVYIKDFLWGQDRGTPTFVFPGISQDEENLMRQYCFDHRLDGVIILRRLNLGKDKKHYMLDAINGIRALGSQSELRYCSFMGADYIYNILCQGDFVYIKVDTESG
eukprot:GILI01023793.1.p1 GENE.GILI01023793.1~~GILI01023793.1.p1  ORF type:complete len:163 (-),score=9.18 GILI01023793.1:85-501(-)